MRIQSLRSPSGPLSFGAIVDGVRLRSIRSDSPEFFELRDAWHEFGLLIFPGQFLSRDEQDDFGRLFGDLEFEAAAITNLRRDGSTRSDVDDDVVKSLRGNEGWHHDSTYMPVQAKGAVFTAEIVPDSGGATGWADMRAAYEALSDEDRDRISELQADHSLEYSMGRAGYLPTANEEGGYSFYGYHGGPAPRRPLIKEHPATGRPNLNIGRHAHNVSGLDDAASETLLDRLNEAACQGDRVHHHQWAPGDAVLWDNRRLMHRATPYDMTQPRRMWHTRIAGDPATETALNY